ncbi:head-tail connector protein [Clostridium perfringens]
MQLEEIKKFLKIDFDDEDEYLNLLIGVATEYIEDALGKFNSKRYKQKFLFLTLIKDMYENRDFTIKENSNVKYIIRSIIMQESLKGDFDD